MGCPVFLMPYRLAAILFGRGYIRLLKWVKEGVEFEITVQESRGFRVRALQRRVLAEKTVGTLLLDNLPSAFAYHKKRIRCRIQPMKLGAGI